MIAAQLFHPQPIAGLGVKVKQKGSGFFFFFLTSGLQGKRNLTPFFLSSTLAIFRASARKANAVATRGWPLLQKLSTTACSISK